MRVSYHFDSPFPRTKIVPDMRSTNCETGPPVILSHSGARGVCSSQRNMDDALLKRVADAGGIIGVTLFEPALCGDDLVDSFAKTVRYIVDVTQNVKALALGSDWDGAIRAVVTSDQTDVLAGVLLKTGFSEREVEQILYDNAIDFFEKSLL